MTDTYRSRASTADPNEPGTGIDAFSVGTPIDSHPVGISSSTASKAETDTSETSEIGAHLRCIDDTDAQDIIADSTTALVGIADALAYRTAVYPDEMLELLAEAAEHHAAQLRRLLD